MRCHRGESYEGAIGGGTNSNNLACSGSKTVDVHQQRRLLQARTGLLQRRRLNGQALALQQYATTHNVRMVVVSIGGNNYNFGSIVQTCVSNWARHLRGAKNYCQDDSDVVANFTTSNVTAQTTAIKNGLLNIRQAMRNAGYADSPMDAARADLHVAVAAPALASATPRAATPGRTSAAAGSGTLTPPGPTTRRCRPSTTRCATPSPSRDHRRQGARSGHAFNGRRLCETTVGLLEEMGLASWTSTGASDKTEWINTIRTVTACCGNYYIQESLHPNYWGQLALRNCVRQAWNGGTTKGGACVRGANGKNGYGEPNMTLQ